MFLMTLKEKKEYVATLENTAKKRSQWRDIFGRLLRNKLGMVGFAIVAILLILIIFAGLFTRFPYDEQSFGERFLYPSWRHPLGTDDFGRDMWSRLLYGGRTSMLVSVIAVILSLGVGIIFGAIAGYFGGKIEIIIMRVMDVIMAIPSLLLAIAISAALGSGPINTAIAISISGMPAVSRIMRSTVMSIKGNEFVEAARATGSTHIRVIFKHILGNSLAPLIVSSTLRIGGNIMAISGLSFIGLGVQPPIPEWGSILSAGRPFIRDFWPMIVFPGLFIMLTLFGFNLFGDALRDALDPKLKD